MEYLKVVPKWFLAVAAVYVAILFTYAIVDGRRVTFWPPSIAGKTSIADESHSIQKATGELEAEIAKSVTTGKTGGFKIVGRSKRHIKKIH